MSSGTNNANFYDYYDTGNGGYTNPPDYLTTVGTFAASPGPYGTFDMGGDVWQWNEAIIRSFRGLRGGSWVDISVNLASSDGGSYDVPGVGGDSLGFRVASVPEPGSITLLVAGVVGGLVCWRRRR